jgi:hypothetical protein
MWPECGARSLYPFQGGWGKPICRRGYSGLTSPKKSGFVLTTTRSLPYIPPPWHVTRRFRGGWRASEAPHWNSEKASDCSRMHAEFRRLPGSPGRPGCLKSESEERETWTAGSLRTAFSWGSNFPRETVMEETSAVTFLDQGTLLSVLDFRTQVRRCRRSVGGPRQMWRMRSQSHAQRANVTKPELKSHPT